MNRFVRIVLCLSGLAIVNDAHLFTKYSENILKDQHFENTLNLIEPRNLIDNLQKFKIDRLSVECDRDLTRLKEALVQRELWALKMLDASSKIPPGLLEGNFIEMGNYDECVDILQQFSSVKIHSHLCSYSINVEKGNATLPLNPTLSICLPTTCTPKDIADLLINVLSTKNKTTELKIEFDNAKCVSNNKEIWDTGFIISILVISSIISFLILCTLCDFMKNNDSDAHKNTTVETLAEFSLKRSAKKIFSLETGGGIFPEIHGIKFISAAWVVLGHECVVRLLSIHDNALYLVKQTQSWPALIIFNGQYAVDTFFTLSGFLMTYIFLKHIGTHKKINVPALYLHRYLRVTPGIIVILICAIFFMPKLNVGPHWDTVMEIFVTESCRKKWWTTLLYIHNIVDINVLCLPQLWYVGADMQLFWISPLILYPLYKNPRLGLNILSACLIISLIIQISVISIKQAPMASLFHQTDYSVVVDTFVTVYTSTYFHTSPWFIGMFLGYEVVNHNRRIKKLVIVTGWLLASAGFAFCYFGLRYFMEPDYVYNVILETSFVTMTRPIWALSICWIIYASIKGCAGLISSFLRWRIFLPLSRISYSLYLVHMIIQLSTYGIQKVPLHQSSFNVFISYVTSMAFSTAAAFIFSLLFESPILVLEKILLNKAISQNKSMENSGYCKDK